MTTGLNIPPADKKIKNMRSSLLRHTVSTLTVASFRTWRGSATFHCTGLDLKELK